MNLSPRKHLSQKYFREYYVNLICSVDSHLTEREKLEECIELYVPHKRKKYPVYVSDEEILKIEEFSENIGYLVVCYSCVSPKHADLTPHEEKANGTIFMTWRDSASWVNEVQILPKLTKLEQCIKALIYSLNETYNCIESIPSEYINHGTCGSDARKKEKFSEDITMMVSDLKETLAEVNKHYKNNWLLDEERSIERKRIDELKKQAQDIAEQEAKNEKKRLEIEAEQEDKKNWENKLQISNKKYQQDSELENEKNRLHIQKEEARNKQSALHLQAEKDKQQFILEKAQADADTAALKNISKVDDIPVRYFHEYLKGKFAYLTKDNLSGEDHNTLLEMHGWFQAIFTRNNMISPERLEAVAPDVKRINQIETIMDLYGEKIRKVKHDDALDEEERQMKVEYWMRLRDRDINELEK